MRNCIKALAVSYLMFAAVGPAFSQSGAASKRAEGYPAKPIHIVVGYAPGGGNDIVARLTGAKMQESWGKPVIVDNKPAANAVLALEYVAKSAPDGYTLLMHANSGMTMNPFLYSKLPYDPVKDFVPVGMVGVLPLVVAVHPSVPVRSVQELIAFAKSNPGKLNSGAGATTFDVASEMFKQMAGIDVKRISYKGSGPTATALVSGEVQMAVIDTPVVMAHIKAGKVRALALTTAKRNDLLPGVPTVMESGVPGYEMVVSIGLFAPAAVPRDIIDKLYGELVRITRLPDIREKLLAMGIDPVGYGPEQVAAMIKSETAKFGPVIKAANIKLQ